NTLIRSRAKKMGLKVNEYEISGPEGSVFPETEEAFYAALGLSWIPPELREGEEEIEAAEKGRLPRLVSPEEIKGVIHAHSDYSDGLYPMEELALECRTRGFSYLCVSDHSTSAGYAGGLSAERLMRQADEIARLNARLAPFRIFHGIESDIRADGSLDYPDHVLDRLDFVIGAIHSKLTMDKAEATGRLLTAIRNPRLTILAHPSGRLLLSREGYAYDADAVLKEIAKHKVVLEHNCHPSRLDPGWRLLKQAGRLGITVSINPDLHGPEGFDHISLGVLMARKAWLGPTQILNCRGTEELSEFFTARKRRPDPHPGQ
ncbi:MAG TPA: hypothetical protein ENN69_06320, partial [Spirochaetia bacterium]|nr:hypothetical protein [Spirochaetia bacterium]